MTKSKQNKKPEHQKDISQKQLLMLNDVFADLLNNFVLSEDDQLDLKNPGLTDEIPRGFYKADNILHENERDVIKSLSNASIHIASVGLENQSSKDKNMALRIMGYDGISYQKQYLQIQDDYSPVKSPHPVLTYVLYLGDDSNYDGIYSLLDIMDMDSIPKSIQKELKLMKDYKFRVINVPNLTEEQIKKFKSDFYVVADYFSQINKNGKYIPSNHHLDHPHETLQFLSVFSKDEIFKEMVNEKGDYENMQEVVNTFQIKFRNQMANQIKEDLFNEGIEHANLVIAQNMLKDNLPISMIMKYTNLSETEIQKIADSLQNE